ncbi:unnamed protein product [Trichobilharzia regenti]|nr:unnamed protein product [Trichobilharzia regenti]
MTPTHQCPHSECEEFTCILQQQGFGRIFEASHRLQVNVLTGKNIRTLEECVSSNMGGWELKLTLILGGHNAFLWGRINIEYWRDGLCSKEVSVDNCEAESRSSGEYKNIQFSDYRSMQLPR